MAKQQQNVFLGEDVPMLSQDNSGESAVFEKRMLYGEDERQVGKLTRLKYYANIHCCKVEVKCFCFCSCSLIEKASTVCRKVMEMGKKHSFLK